jgi:hypothetical protein
MLLVTIPEWGHLSPFLHLAASIQRNWDTSSRGKLQLSIASMEQVRAVVCCALCFPVVCYALSPPPSLQTQQPQPTDTATGTARSCVPSSCALICLAPLQVRTKIEARGIDFVSIGAWEKQEQAEYERCSRCVLREARGDITATAILVACSACDCWPQHEPRRPQVARN